MRQITPEEYGYDDDDQPADEYVADGYRWLPAPPLNEPETIKRAPKARHDKIMRQRAWMAAFAETGNKRLACGAAGVARSTVHAWEHEEGADGEAFRAVMAVATEQAIETLEAEARRRAVHGVRKVKRTFFKGDLVDESVEINYSDTLLIFLLKGAAPDKYADRAKVDHTHRIEEVARRIADRTGDPVDVVTARLVDLTAERGRRSA